MIKWGVCGEAVDDHSKKLSEFLNASGVPNEVIAVPTKDFDFNGEVDSGRPIPFVIPSELVWLRIPHVLGQSILNHLPRATQECRELQYCDGVVIEKNIPWPRIGISVALTRTFSEFDFIDTTKAALIVGANGRARAAASAAVTLGFKRVVFASSSEESMKLSVELLRRTHFATEFEIISSDRLIEVASAFSICIFANDATLDESFRTELSFFNFLTPDGVIVDLSGEIESTSLKAAAKEANVRVVPAQTPLLFFDSTWVEWIFHHDLDLKEFQKFSSGQP